MTALKLSYDQLPYSLQQCFAYCSIFPDGYRFHGGELARIWISQGFVKLNNHSSKILEEIVQNYLAPLVNLGFFQQVERQESSPGSQTCYALCGLMHDFARMVSLTECTTIDGIRSNKMSPTIRHLSIVTDSEYRKNEHGNIPRNEKFEKNLRDTVTSVSKLRTLVLLGHYDSFFLQLFQDIFRKAHNLRLLQMTATSADFPKHGYDEVDGALPQVLSKLYHLQVLNVGSYTNPSIPDGITNLVSLRHLVVHKGVYSSIATIGSLTSFQEPHGFEFQIFSNFEITQPQSTDERVHDWVHQLDNVKTLKEIYEAVLKKNELLGKLQLSTEIGMELIPNRSARSSKLSVDTAREELERFEVRQHLKSLQIHGYKCSDATSPTCLVSNILFTSLLKLQLYGCRKWEILPSLDTLQFLTKLKLSNLRRVIQISVPSLEELVLVQMPKLERCSCTSVEGMNSRLRALQIEQCYALNEFDLFENDDDEQRSWLPGIRKLTLRDCPHLKVLKPLPPSTACFELLIGGVSTLPSMDGSSTEKLQIRYDVGKEDGNIDIGESSDESWILDDKILAFQNLRNLKSVIILDCQRLSSFSFKGFSHLFHLKNLEMRMCDLLFSSDVMTDATHEDVTAANWKAFPYLESLSIKSCGITGKWLSLLLRHAPQLEELHLGKLSTEGDTPRGLARDGLVYIPLNLISSLKKITIDCCPRLIFNWSDEGFSGITSVQELLSSLVHKGGDDDWANGRWLLPTSLDEFEISSSYFHKTLQPCFPSDLTSLKRLQVGGGPGLETLQLRSCTALEELIIYDCVLLVG
uniref:Uncharacterized protein n=1 Tax=Avena sativa TaxID=4498 RepID=A0ACD5XDH7_AVESA